MKTQATLATFVFLIFGSLAAAQNGTPAPFSSASASASTSYNDPVLGNHVGVIPKGWPPPTGDACHNSADEIEDAHVVHDLGLAALAKKLPHESLFYWRLAYVESCKTPKILVNVAIAAEQAGDIAGAIEALELLELRGTLAAEDHQANQQKLLELRALLPKPAVSASASVAVSASPSVLASAPASYIAPKSQTNWLAISGFSLAGIGLLSGAGFGTWALAEKNTMNTKCIGGFCPPDAHSVSNNFNTANALTFVALGVGVVGVGVGIVGLTIGSISSESRKQVSLVFTGNGLSLAGSF